MKNGQPEFVSQAMESEDLLNAEESAFKAALKIAEEKFRGGKITEEELARERARCETGISSVRDRRRDLKGKLH